MTHGSATSPMSMSNLIRRFAWRQDARYHKDARSSPTAETPVPKTRRRLFTKYVGLFVAVVCVALLSNGIFDVFFYYQEHKASLIRIQREQAEAACRQDRPVRQGDREPARLDNATTLVSGLDRAAPL